MFDIEIQSESQAIMLLVHLVDHATGEAVSTDDHVMYLALNGWAPGQPGFLEILQTIDHTIVCSLEGRNIRLEAWADALLPGTDTSGFPDADPDFTANFVGQIQDESSICP